MSEQMTQRTTCGRCGVYRDLHPTSTCEKSRRSFWWDEHYLWRHIAAWLWLRLSDRRRMDLVHRYWSRHKHLCWCEFVDAALLDDKRDDYADDLCDVPLPFGVGLPRLGWCYCSPDNALTTPPAYGVPREGVGTGAGEGATGQDTGTAWVTRSADCPEAPAQAHPLAARTKESR